MNKPAVFFTSLLTSIVASTAIYFVLNFAIPPPHLRWGPKKVEQPKVQTVLVPNLQGLEPAQARNTLKEKGLLLWVQGREESEEVPKGRILSQLPLPESVMLTDDKVHVTISIGSTKSAVPAVKGATLDAAKAKIQAAKLAVGSVSQKPSPSAAGSVLAQTPAPGTQVKKGTPVNLVVSSGQEMTTVPKVKFRHITKAKKMLEEAGLIVGDLRYVDSDDYDDNIITAQDPDIGAKVPKGTKVNLSIVRF